jgi:hypothetical protein
MIIRTVYRMFACFTKPPTGKNPRHKASGDDSDLQVLFVFTTIRTCRSPFLYFTFSSKHSTIYEQYFRLLLPTASMIIISK